MVDKITNPPSQKDLIDKVNELVDDKQDTLVSGTNIKTINNTSILGSGNISVGVSNPLRIEKTVGTDTYFYEVGINNNNRIYTQCGVDREGLDTFIPLPTSYSFSGTDIDISYGSYSDTQEYIKTVSLSIGSNIARKSDIPTVPTNISAFTNDSGYITASSLPTVNNATLTITQGGVSKGTFTANASSDVTIALDSGGSSLTAGTGIDITNDVISVEGVKDQQNTATAIKTWTGTRAQYDAIVSKDSNTLYNITDDTDTTLTLLEALYPVGSVYITTASTCPLSTLISGSSWSLVSSGRVLQGADSGHSAGTTIEAGLPNITGEIKGCESNSSHQGSSGVFTHSSTDGGEQNGNGTWVTFNFNASRSSSIYGNSNTVQPPAYVVNIFRRTL
jgi:hypothetical protein